MRRSSACDTGSASLICQLHCMERGASIDFLSVYEHEEEVIFPPLTYLQLKGISEEDVCGSKVLVALFKNEKAVALAGYAGGHSWDHRPVLRANRNVDDKAILARFDSFLPVLARSFRGSF